MDKFHLLTKVIVRGELQTAVGVTHFNKYLYSTHNDKALAQGENRQPSSCATGRKGTIWFSKDPGLYQQSTATELGKGKRE